MLNRRNRLLTSNDFRIVLRRGKKFPVNGGLIAILRTDVAEPLRFGFVVSKAVGNAVVRNRVKRRLRAASSLLAHDYRGADVVVRTDQQSPHISVEQWGRDLSASLTKVAGQ